MQKLIPYTVTNFKDITQQYYYVDKTMYLPKLEKYRHPVFLRPRRFGKSLFTEMLRYYYDIKYADEFEQIFGKLWIGKNPTPNRNKYFFLKLSFSDLGTYAKEDERILEKHFRNKVVSELKQFIDDNEQTGIERVYITGILPITIADMNSGYNVAEWLTFEPEFVNMLGITESEFDLLLDEIYSDIELTIPKQHVKDVVQRYYNGYKFSPESEAVYNPSMTMYALQSLVNNGSLPIRLLDSNLRIDYNQISYLFGKNYTKRDKIIASITEKKQLFFSSTLNVSFNMNSYREGRYIAEGLYYSGILTYTENPYILSIPNIVTYDMTIGYFNEIKEIVTDADDTGEIIQGYIMSGNAQDLITKFFESVIQKFPGQFFSNANESFYHGLLFHILFNSMPKNMYEVLPEYNLPQGRADIMCRTLPGAKVAAEFQDLFEMKQVPKSADDEAFEAMFSKAKEQAERYTQAGWRAVAVCFRGNKDFLIEVKQF